MDSDNWSCTESRHGVECSYKGGERVVVLGDDGVTSVEDDLNNVKLGVEGGDFSAK